MKTLNILTRRRERVLEYPLMLSYELEWGNGTRLCSSGSFMRMFVWSIPVCKSVTTSIWSELHLFIEAKARGARREAGQLTGA